MRGLEHEFERFREVCLESRTPEEVASAERLFFAGALAGSARILGILDSGLPPPKQLALLRRVAREMEAYQQKIAAEADANGR